ncbi:MAG: molybdopterin-dependent oxidoreductase, partial [Acidobacteria bacterium]|nr:molybdopterin-dependent oxidoreductase [Acidobacteriota bacterium]
MSTHNIIGKALPMTDSPGKVTGLGRYTDDLAVPGMLFGKILHCPHAHARIRSINTAKAEALPGVKAVATGKDAPNPFGILPIGHDERVFSNDKGRYIGDNIAAVAAITEEIAEEALDLIEVDWEILPAFTDPLKSMEAPEAHWLHAEKAKNIEKEYHHVFGDVDAGFARADFVREEKFFAGEVNHAAMEPNATLAIWEPDGRMTVHSST